jgi:hypothetical protein|uniref:Uncharacterized protein n=1 Tax=Siphoviridae sp. ctXPH7 TaxID=2826367 RepID=A0A8S5LXZ0_9CAUD|nr:MAG TPA: hypothetical protein [Siphoviridae sp. ctXPH7]DAQ32885.1 MAG TPA: hypothetical protein [Caudoviricetes sp.]DAZ54371.1 MAG TPA: hypothetical protein [Caudoviricetes sp.]
MSKNLYDLREMLCEELDEYNRDAKNGLNERTLDTVHKLTDTIKNIDKIMMLEDGDYSRTGEWEADMRGNYGRTENYNRGNSYANRGRHYVRGHYSRGDGRERMISDIENMMQDATGAERDAYKRALDILNNM